VEAAGGKALILRTDVANAEKVDEAATKVEETFGPIEIWVNNAMTTAFSPVKEMTPEEFKRVTEVTYLGYVNGTLAALHRMLPRDRGVIVQVGSALAYGSIPLQAAYCASKHAIRGFTASLRTELLHDRSKVRVTMVQMPALNTPQFDWCQTRLPRKPQPVPPIYQPEMGAEAIYWAAHHDRRELFVGWSTVLVIQLNKILPGLAGLYLARTGYRSQQYDGPVDPDRPIDLWEPVDQTRDYGAHGAFDDRAHARTSQFWIETNRSLIGLTAAGILGAAYAFRKRER
jgi:NAD(P)-dependent dehydrogenase (short-subunit alcohol dehydrogenase family)